MNQGLRIINSESSLITKIVIVSSFSSKILTGSNNKDLRRSAFALTIYGVMAKIAVSGRSAQQNEKCLVESTIDQEFYNRSVKYFRNFMIRKTAFKEEPNHEEHWIQSGRQENNQSLIPSALLQESGTLVDFCVQ